MTWKKDVVGLPDDSEILSVLVSPAKRASEGAMPHIQTVSFWPLDDFKSWAKNTLATVRDLRKYLSEPGDNNWRNQAAKVFVEQGLDAVSLHRRLKAQG